MAIRGDNQDGQGFQVEFRPDLLGGVVVLRHRGVVLESSTSTQPLYAPQSPEAPRSHGEVELTFIPYYAWANRGPSAMRVWVPYLSSRGATSESKPAEHQQ